MKLKLPDYDNCLTNLTNSILKHFGAETKHGTLNELDTYLNLNDYKNIVLLLYDGLGSNLLKRNLAKEAFLNKHTIKSITSVFPSTTTASTTTVLSGLNPVEHCWLGWDIYVESYDKTVTMFLNVLKGTQTTASDKHIAHDEFPYKDIFDQINETQNAKAYCISPFGGSVYNKDTPDEMYDRILEMCDTDERKFIYAYYPEPDALMHEFGTAHDKVIRKMEYINMKTEELCRNLKDSLIIITADHGHIDAENIVIEDYPEFQDMLIRETSLERRVTNFFVKKDRLKEFKTKFKEICGEDFLLLSKQEVIEQNWFGTGGPNSKFYSCLGDYVSIAISDKAIYDRKKHVKEKALHAGITEDEVLVPLIIIDKKIAKNAE